VDLDTQIEGGHVHEDEFAGFFAGDETWERESAKGRKKIGINR
jgi:hypothetical protein